MCLCRKCSAGLISHHTCCVHCTFRSSLAPSEKFSQTPLSRCFFHFLKFIWNLIFPFSHWISFVTRSFGYYPSLNLDHKLLRDKDHIWTLASTLYPRNPARAVTTVGTSEFLLNGQMPDVEGKHFALKTTSQDKESKWMDTKTGGGVRWIGRLGWTYIHD